MLNYQIPKPKKRLNANMMAESADMAAEQMQVAPNMQMAKPQPQQQQKPAPVIPTTNFRMPTRPMSMASGMSSGAPQQDMASGSMNVTGGGEQRAADIAAREREAESRRSARASGDWQLQTNPEAITNRAIQESGQVNTDDALEDAIADLLAGGPRNTAEEEEQIRKQMETDVSAGQAGLNARLAAGGGGTSGALGALSTDMRARAALDAAGTVQDVRRDARDEYLDRLRTGIGAKFNDRTADMDEAEMEMMLEMIRQMYGNETPTDVPQAQTPSQSQFDSAREVSSRPEGSTLAFSGSGYNVYEKDGVYYKVRVNTMRPNTNV